LILAKVLRAVAILNFLKDLESPVHGLFTIYYDKFSFNQVFRSKTPCSCVYRANFAGFCVYHTDLSGGGGGKWDRPAQQSEHPFTTKMRPFIHRLSVSQTSERFLPEVKNVAFCIWILKSV
jgi:hypothetical protein